MKDFGFFSKIEPSQSESNFIKLFPFIFLFTFILLLVFEIFVVKVFFDSLLVSGILLFLIGLLFATQLSINLKRMLIKIIDRGGIQANIDQINILEDDLVRTSKKFARRGGIVISIFFLITLYNTHYTIIDGVH